MRYALITHIAKAVNVPQSAAEQLVRRNNLEPVGRYGGTVVYDADHAAVRLKVKSIESLSEEDARGVVSLNRPAASRNNIPDKGPFEVTFE